MQKKKVASRWKRGFKWIAAGVGLAAALATILTYLNLEVLPPADQKLAVTDAYELFALPPQGEQCQTLRGASGSTEAVEVWLKPDDGCWSKASGPVDESEILTVLIRYVNEKSEGGPDVNIALSLDRGLSLVERSTYIYDMSERNGRFVNHDLLGFTGVDLGQIATGEQVYVIGKVEIVGVYVPASCDSEVFEAEGQAYAGFALTPAEINSHARGAATVSVSSC